MKPIDYSPFEHHNHKTAALCELAVELATRSYQLPQQGVLNALLEQRAHKTNTIRWLNIQLLEEFFRVNADKPALQLRAIRSAENLLQQISRYAVDYPNARALVVRMKNHAPATRSTVARPDYHMVCLSDWGHV